MLGLELCTATESVLLPCFEVQSHRNQEQRNDFELISLLAMAPNYLGLEKKTFSM